MLPAMAGCPDCATQNPAGARFCNGCGARLGTAGSAPAAHEERKIVTVLFADLVGFTARAETLDPEDILALVRPFHELLRTETERFGGTLARIVGDAGMVIFGYPTAHEDDPERAVRAGLAILAGLERLDAERPGLDLHARIGINTAEAVVTYGSTLEDADDLMGDGVNTAARLQAAAPVDGVVVGEATYRATGHLFRYAALPPVAAKGKAEPVALWRAIAAVARLEQDRDEATPFVGRDVERSLLIGLFERSRTTPSVEIVTIVADPGLGKSRLVRELAHHVEGLPDPVTWRTGRCLPYGDGIGLWALGEIVKSHAGIFDTDDQATLAAKLDAALVEPDPSMRGWMADRLAPLVGLETATEPPAQEEAFTAWRRFLEQVAQSGPTVFVIEDLHWADDTLVGFLQHVAEHTAGLPLLLLTTARPELAERHRAWLARARRATVLSLAALPDTAMKALVAGSLPGASPGLIETVLARAGGSPLYAEQLAAMLRDRVTGIAPGAMDPDAIPASIAALLASRIDALPPETKAILLDASVIGKAFWSGAVAALSGRDRDDVGLALAELARRELIRPVYPSTMAGEAEFTFWHALIRDVAYGELTRGARLARHRVAAAWITERAGAALGEDAEIVVAHLERARDLATATGATDQVPAIETALVDALLAAADTSMRTDVPRGIGLLKRALDAFVPGDPQRPEVLGRLGRGLRDLEEYAEAVVAFDEARRLYASDGRDVEAALLAPWLARVHLARGEAEIGDRIFDEAGVVLRREGGPALVSHLAFSAQRAWTLLRNDDALRLAEEALSMARDQGMPPPYRALNARGTVRMDMGDRSGGEADLRRAVALAGEAGDFSSAMVAKDNLAVSLDVYSVADALAATAEAIDFARARGVRWSYLEVARLGCLWALGRWDDAVAGARSLDARASAVGDAYLHVFATACEVAIELDRGECRRDPADLASQARSFGRAYALDAMFPLAARLAAQQDRASLAASLLEELLDAGVAAGHLYSGPASVRAAAETGRPDLAQRLLALGVPAARRSGLADAIVAEAEGDSSVARGWYARAVEMTRSVGSVPDEAYALAGLGRCLLAEGEIHGAVARLHESRATWERLGATPRIAEIDAILAAGTA